MQLKYWQCSNIKSHLLLVVIQNRYQVNLTVPHSVQSLHWKGASPIGKEVGRCMNRIRLGVGLSSDNSHSRTPRPKNYPFDQLVNFSPSSRRVALGQIHQMLPRYIYRQHCTGVCGGRRPSLNITLMMARQSNYKQKNMRYEPLCFVKSEIRKYAKYAKYGALWNFEKSQIRKYAKYAKYGAL